MPALAPYIPVRDAAFQNWLTNFSTLITAAPATYGLTSVDAMNISGAAAVFTAAYGVVTSPATKTAQAVAAKNQAKVAALDVVRPYSQTIKLNQGVAVGSKIALGLNPGTSTPGPVTPPASNPVLTVQSASIGAIILRYRDSAASVSVKAKPYGVKQCMISYGTSATAVTDPTLLGSVVPATKSPLVVQFNAADFGKQAYFAARWMTASGKFSPWSSIISFTVPQGA